jgi:DNA-binding NarL/FixJ family response regulator
MTAKGRPATGLWVVVIDDNELVRHGVRALIEAHGGEVCAEAATYAEALAWAAQVRPEIVVLDAALPEVDKRRRSAKLLAQSRFGRKRGDPICAVRTACR